MIEPFCPNPVCVQQLDTGPWGTSIDAFAHPLVPQGYASWTTQSTRRLLADRSRWLPPHTLMATDLNAQGRPAFLQDRSPRGCAPRDDRARVRRLLEPLRPQGVLPVPDGARARGGHFPVAGAFPHDLLHQRCLAPRTVPVSRDTVQRVLGARFGALPLRLERLGARDVTAFRGQQARDASPTRAQVIAPALRSFVRFVLQHGISTHDRAPAVPTVPHGRWSTLPTLMKAEDVAGLLQSGERSTPHGHRDDAIWLLLARLG